MYKITLPLPFNNLYQSQMAYRHSSYLLLLWNKCIEINENTKYLVVVY